MPMKTLLGPIAASLLQQTLVAETSSYLQELDPEAATFSSNNHPWTK